MRVLVIDAEECSRKTTTGLLERLGHEVVVAENGATALKDLDRSPFDVAFLEAKPGAGNGLALLPELLRSNPQMNVLVSTATASVETAVEAMRLGAAGYLPRPFNSEQVRQALRKMAVTPKPDNRVTDVEADLITNSPTADLRTDEPAVQRALALAFKAGATRATMMLLGESGTGKTVLARAIHERSPCRDHAFVTVSCPSLSRDLLESELFGRVKGAYTGAVSDTWGKVAAADGGTLFLDEIGELPLEIQPKLLRLLQEKEYERLGEAKTRQADVRVIAATNRHLEAAVWDGRFREDLYYRLNVIAVRLPALRERRRDLPRMAQQYLRFFAHLCGKQLRGFSAETLEIFAQYSWPGNLRELRNVIEHAVILAGGQDIERPDLPEQIVRAVAGQNDATVQVGMKVSLAELETEHIRQVMAQTSTLEEAAEILGIGRTTLYQKKKAMKL